MKITAAKEFTDMRKNMWITAFIFFVFGDVITTIFGTYDPNIIERNPLAKEFFNNQNFIALFLFKFIPFLALFWVDTLVVDYLDEFAFPVIPLFLSWKGIDITIRNIEILSTSVTNADVVIITIIGVSIAVIQFTKIQLGYDITET